MKTSPRRKFLPFSLTQYMTRLAAPRKCALTRVCNSYNLYVVRLVNHSRRLLQPKLVLIASVLVLGSITSRIPVTRMMMQFNFVVLASPPVFATTQQIHELVITSVAFWKPLVLCGDGRSANGKAYSQYGGESEMLVMIISDEALPKRLIGVEVASRMVVSGILRFCGSFDSRVTSKLKLGRYPELIDLTALLEQALPWWRFILLAMAVAKARLYEDNARLVIPSRPPKAAVDTFSMGSSPTTRGDFEHDLRAHGSRRIGSQALRTTTGCF